MYSETAQQRIEGKCCPNCGQPMPTSEKYGIRVGPTAIYYQGIATRLSPYHLRMFEMLLRFSPEPVTRERLYAMLYSEEADGGPHSRPLDALMFGMRRKLKNSGLQIETLYALGWRLVPPSVLDT